MQKNEILEKLLKNKNPVDFFGLNAPDTIDVIVNESGKIISFNRIDCLSETTATESKQVYQSSVSNNYGEFPIIEIATTKKFKYGKTQYIFVYGFNKTSIW